MIQCRDDYSIDKPRDLHLTGTQWCQVSDVAEHAGTSSKRLLAAIDRVARSSRPIFELRTSLMDNRRKEIRLSVDVYGRLRSLHESYNRQFGGDINLDALKHIDQSPLMKTVAESCGLLFTHNV